MLRDNPPRVLEELLALFRRMTEGFTGYSIVLLDKDGYVLSWNKGIEKIKGYSAEDIIGQHYSIFYLPEDHRRGLPKKIPQ